MMMTRFVLTLVLGVLLSLGTVVTGGFFGQAQAGNFDLAIRYQKSLKAQMEMEKKRHLENCEGKLSDQRRVRV